MYVSGRMSSVLVASVSELSWRIDRSDMRLTATSPDTLRCLRVSRDPKATSQFLTDQSDVCHESLNDNVVSCGVVPRP